MANRVLTLNLVRAYVDSDSVYTVTAAGAAGLRPILAALNNQFGLISQMQSGLKNIFIPMA